MAADKTAFSVIVTGGASGIGAATARRLVAAGGRIGILDVDRAAAEAVAGELGGAAAVADVTDENEMAVAVDALAAELPPINGLVNCAGIAQPPTRIEDYPLDDWSRVMDVHLRGTYIACRIVGGAMAKRGFGAVVNIASVLSFRPGPVLAYGPAKAAVVSLTQSLAVQWARRGVRVNAVAPGWTDTPLLRTRKRRDFKPIIEATPMGRLMRPEEIAEVVHFLLSPAASGITGATVPCDGGVMAGGGWFPYGGFPED